MAITVGELRTELANYPSDAEIYFEELTFYRVKSRGEKIVQIEFNEALITGNDKTNTFETTKAMFAKFGGLSDKS